MDNKMKIEFLSKSHNEGFARMVVSAFVLECDPTIEELNDIKTAVSEAVTNSIIHGYNLAQDKIITMEGDIKDNTVTITITDNGKGIRDIKKAREPMWSEKPNDERSGLGFTIMESFMDTVLVQSAVGEGTQVILTKHIGEGRE